MATALCIPRHGAIERIHTFLVVPFISLHTACDQQKGSATTGARAYRWGKPSSGCFQTSMAAGNAWRRGVPRRARRREQRRRRNIGKPSARFKVVPAATQACCLGRNLGPAVMGWRQAAKGELAPRSRWHDLSAAPVCVGHVKSQRGAKVEQVGVFTGLIGRCNAHAAATCAERPEALPTGGPAECMRRRS